MFAETGASCTDFTFRSLTAKAGQIGEQMREVAMSNSREELDKRLNKGMLILSLGVVSVVDDDESVREATTALLRSIGYEVRTFASAELFLATGALQETVCLVLDVRMPGIDGLELQRRLNEAKSVVPIIFVTAHDDKSHRKKAIDAGAAEFFHKPFDARAFVAAINAAVSCWQGYGRKSLSEPKETELHRDVGPVAC